MTASALPPDTGPSSASGSSTSHEVVVRADKLVKTFHLGFFRRRVEAVREISFEVRRGEIFGFLGPNGAGKTTTLKMLMGLVQPGLGRAELFGRPVPNREARRKVGYLPESPYFYEYLTPEELLDFAGALFDLPRAARRARADALIRRVGLDHARGRALRKFSKGMLQRIGIAQALMGDPELVIFDEPMTGLDPMGRKEIRDLILSLRDEGKTVLFSTHILPDVEMTCDRVAIVAQGRVRAAGPLATLLSTKLEATELVLRLAGPMPTLPAGAKSRPTPDGLSLELPPETDVDAFLRAALADGHHVLHLQRRRESLEDLFLRAAGNDASAVTTEANPS